MLTRGWQPGGRIAGAGKASSCGVAGGGGQARPTRPNSGGGSLQPIQVALETGNLAVQRPRLLLAVEELDALLQLVLLCLLCKPPMARMPNASLTMVSRMQTHKTQ